MIDLRSDTVTQPPEHMRKAMAQAEVGDDYYHDDPTVERLESFAAEILGFEAGLFVTSGTMGNLVSILTHTQMGDAVIMEERAHIFHNENGNIAAIANVLPRPLSGDRGILSPKTIEENITGSEVLHSRTRLVCIENTHNVCGGIVWSLEELAAVWNLTKSKGIALHVDGARIFNAAVALDVEPAKLTEGADSLTFCLSKGLSCPFGSLIVGSQDFIAEARRNRQMTGGGMRQAGIMAAAGVVALESMVSRLSEDHENARTLGNGLANLGLEVDQDAIHTNMVYANIPASMNISDESFGSGLQEHGVRVNGPYGGRVRFVTHFGITEDDINTTLQVIERVLNNESN